MNLQDNFSNRGEAGIHIPCVPVIIKEAADLAQLMRKEIPESLPLDVRDSLDELQEALSRGFQAIASESAFLLAALTSSGIAALPSDTKETVSDLLNLLIETGHMEPYALPDGRFAIWSEL